MSVDDDTRDQTIAALDTRLAAVEDRNLELTRERDDARADARAATQERDNALRVADEALATARAATDERNAIFAQLADRNALAARVTELEANLVENELAEARRAGILRAQRDEDGRIVETRAEARLRRIAKEDGLDAMRAELAEMPRLMPPLGRAVLDEHDPNPRAGHGPIPATVLASTAAQLEIEPDALAEHADALGTKGAAS